MQRRREAPRPPYPHAISRTYAPLEATHRVQPLLRGEGSHCVREPSSPPWHNAGRLNPAEAYCPSQIGTEGWRGDKLIGPWTFRRKPSQGTRPTRCHCVGSTAVGTTAWGNGSLWSCEQTFQQAETRRKRPPRAQPSGHAHCAAPLDNNDAPLPVVMKRSPPARRILRRPRSSARAWSLRCVGQPSRQVKAPVTRAASARALPAGPPA